MGLLLHYVINIINIIAIIYNIAFLRFLGPNLPGPNLLDRIYRNRINLAPSLVNPFHCLTTLQRPNKTMEHSVAGA